MEMGLRAGLTHEQIDALRFDPAGGQFTEREQIVIDYAERLSKSGSGIPDEIFSRLRKHFNEAEVVSLTLSISLMSLLNRYTEALRLHGD